MTGIGHELGQGIRELSALQTHVTKQLQCLRFLKIVSSYEGNVRAYVRWRSSLPGKTPAAKRFAEMSALIALHPQQPAEKSFAQHMVDLHGSKPENWDKRIPRHIKRQMLTVIKKKRRKSLNPLWDDESVRDRFAERVSGQPC